MQPSGRYGVMGDSRSDAELIEASLQRPVEFGHVFERHWDAVFRFFERRLGPSPAEDLASEVFRIAYERRERYETWDSASCRPWLYGIAANLALKERRRFARHLAAVDRAARMGDPPTEDHAPAVAARVDSKETWSRLQTALVAIDDPSREMLLLVAWEGLSYQDLSEAFEVPIGTVRSRLHRARVRLRNLLTADTPPSTNSPIREENA